MEGMTCLPCVCIILIGLFPSILLLLPEVLVPQQRKVSEEYKTVENVGGFTAVVSIGNLLLLLLMYLH